MTISKMYGTAVKIFYEFLCVFSDFSMGSIMGTRAQASNTEEHCDPYQSFVNIYDLSIYGSNCFR